MLLFTTLLLLVNLLPTQASGGVSIFLQNAELQSLGICLIVLVFLTITFELCIHNIQHWVEGWAKGASAGLAVIAKVNAELTVLGFISALVLVVVNLPYPSAVIAPYIANLEVAHLWLFFVGLMFVVEAVVMLRTAKFARDVYTKGDKMKTRDLLMEDDGISFKKEKASKCCILFCGEKTSCSGDYIFVRHKTYQLLFRHFHNDKIVQLMGKEHASHFDFASYLSYFWQHLLTTIQHIPIISWMSFLVIFWIMVGVRSVNNAAFGANDTDTLVPAIVMNVIVFILMALLVCEQGTLKIEKFRSQCFDSTFTIIGVIIVKIIFISSFLF